MEMLFLDDSKVPSSRRKGVGALTGVGGIKISALKLRSLSTEIERICSEEYRFPRGEIFKWSPSRDQWFRHNVTGEARTKFIRQVLQACLRHEAQFIVSVVDQSKGHAVQKAFSHETDALYLTLERFNKSISRDDFGMAFLAKPSGGASDERKLVSALSELRRLGTSYVQFDRLAADVVVVPFNYSRLMQAADLVASITTAMVAGLDQYAAPVFEDVKNGFIKNSWGQIGGFGLKIHPSHLVNLYHWVVEDVYHLRGPRVLPLPSEHYWFHRDAGT